MLVGSVLGSDGSMTEESGSLAQKVMIKALQSISSRNAVSWLALHFDPNFLAKLEYMIPIVLQCIIGDR